MFVLYVLEGCPFCEKAMEMLKMEKAKFEKIVVSQEKKEEYKKNTGMSTFPMIFVGTGAKDGHYLKVGGSSDLEEYLTKCKEIQNSNLAMDTIYCIYKSIFSKS